MARHRVGTALAAIGVLLWALGASAASGETSDQVAPATPRSLVQERVFLERVYSPELQRPMAAYVYLPPDYFGPGARRYPVVYMHDGSDAFRAGRRGQELRDRQPMVAPATWNVAAILDSVFANDPGDGAIVVAIDTARRVEHFSPWPWSPSHTAAGREYMDFIVQSLKPHIDQRYRTLPDREHTAMLGSSFGGIISMYGLVKYPSVFSKGAILSPVFTPNVLGDQLNNYIELRGPLEDVRLFVDVGSTEPEPMKTSLVRLHQTMVRRGFYEENLRFEIAEGGTHLVSSWQKRFPDALAWLFRW